MTVDEFTQLALSFEGVSEKPHFDRTSFRTNRIFATVEEKGPSANLKFTPEDQSSFCDFGNGAIYAVPNKWGAQGWTTFEFTKLPYELMKDAIETAHRSSLKK